MQLLASATIGNTANTNLDGTTGTYYNFPAPSQGSRIVAWRVIATGNSSAGRLNGFLRSQRHFSASSATYRHFIAIPIAAVTVSGTVQQWSWTEPDDRLVIQGDEFKFATYIGETFFLEAWGDAP